MPCAAARHGATGGRTGADGQEDVNAGDTKAACTAAVGGNAANAGDTKAACGEPSRVAQAPGKGRGDFRGAEPGKFPIETRGAETRGAETRYVDTDRTR